MVASSRLTQSDVTNSRVSNMIAIREVGMSHNRRRAMRASLVDSGRR